MCYSMSLFAPLETILGKVKSTLLVVAKPELLCWDQRLTKDFVKEGTVLWSLKLTHMKWEGEGVVDQKKLKLFIVKWCILRYM